MSAESRIHSLGLPGNVAHFEEVERSSVCLMPLFGVFLCVSLFFPLQTSANDGTDAASVSTVDEWVVGAFFSRPLMRRVDNRTIVSMGNKMVPRADEECCTDPGEIAGCWWEDASQDGAACRDDNDCDSGRSCDLTIRVDGNLPPNGWGLCECSDNDDCGEGVCRDGLCGPSFCNGYRVCACWGGCTTADAWGHDTPYEACDNTDLGFPGLCCEGNYPSNVDGSGFGYCSDDCPEGVECVEDDDCDVSVDDPMSEDCTNIVCVGGSCQVEFVNEGNVCSENAQAPDPFPTWHEDCRRYACTDDGVCYLGMLSAGTSCDDSDDCTASSTCDADGACVAVSPDPTLDECCDPDDDTTFDDENPCTSDICSGVTSATPFRDQHTNLSDNTSCDDGIDRIDDDCGVYVCIGGSCVENTASFVDLDCNVTDWPDCLRYKCSDQAGNEGACVPVVRNNGSECDWPNKPDTCDRKVCQDGACDYELAAETPDCMPFSGIAVSCCEYACSVDHVCKSINCEAADLTIEECEGGDMGSLGTTIGTSLSVAGDSLCARNEYRVATSDLFAACNVTDDGETVHRFVEQTHLTEYQLRHTEITLTDHGTWDPVLYAATSCDAGNTIQADQYTCAIGDSPVIMSGPWPLVDTPTPNNADGYTTENSQTTTVFVDARNTADPSGGSYTLSAEVVAHDNSSCINTADEVQAPRLTGGTDWRVRFKGSTDGYSNYFHELGRSLEEYTEQCGNVDTPNSNDPKFAFFRLDLPSGSEPLDSGNLYWNHKYKLYTDPAATGGLDDVLSLWGNNTPDGNCSGALADMQTCQNPYEDPPLTSPREIVVDNGRSGFVAVSNQESGASGDYELNLLRVPRPFLGLSQQFIGKGEGAAGAGCSCSRPDDANWEQGFQLGGKRLDFIPTNDDVSGYAVRMTEFDVSTPGNWLVQGGDEVCTGLNCTSPSGWESDSGGTSFDMQFQFPYSGELWPYFCIDAAGRIILAKNSSDCVNEWNYKPNTNDFLTGFDPPDGYSGDPPPVTPAIAPLWGTLVPCNIFYKYNSYSNPSRKNLQIENMSVFLQWLNRWTDWFDSWQWMNNRCSSPGQIRRMRTVFEEATAQVITWEGFGGYYYANNHDDGGPGPDHAINFQVILRVDGRITFFYKMPSGGNNDWNFFLDTNGWIIGLSGGRSEGCEVDADCDGAFGTTNGRLSCDVDDFKSIDSNDDENFLWEAKLKCMNSVPLQSSVAIPVPGEWQGE